MVFFMLTNILTESTDLICQGQGAVQLAAKAFHLDLEEATQKEEPILNLPGVVSRKKQLIPELMLAEAGLGQRPGRAGGLRYVKGILETRQHALPGAGCYGQLRQGGRDT